MLPTVRDTTEGRAVCDAGKELASSLKGGEGLTSVGNVLRVVSVLGI
jgi:hypothetical protein